MPSLLLGLWWECVLTHTQGQLWRGEAVDPARLLLGASLRGWSLGGGWSRQPNHDVSPENPRMSKWHVKRLISLSFMGVLWDEWKVNGIFSVPFSPLGYFFSQQKGKIDGGPLKEGVHLKLYWYLVLIKPHFWGAGNGSCRLLVRPLWILGHLTNGFDHRELT